MKRILFLACLIMMPFLVISQNYKEWVAPTTSNWSTPSNWTSGGITFGQLEWKGNGIATSNNDIGTQNHWRLYFAGSKAYTLTGSTVNLFDNGGSFSWVLSDATVAQNINFPLNFADAGARYSYISARGSGGSITFGGNVGITGGITALRIIGQNTNAPITFNSTLSGSKPVDIGRDESGTYQTNTRVFFNADNSSTFSGPTTLYAGTLTIPANSALGTGSLIIGNSSVFNSLAVTGDTSRSQGIIINDGSTNSAIDVAATKTFTFSGALTHNTGGNNATKFGKSGSGTLVVSNANTGYVGRIQIGDGTVIVQNNNGLGNNTTTANRGIDLGLNVGDVSTANNVNLQATNGINIPQSIYVASNASSATRTISFNGASGSASLSNEIYTDGDLTLNGGSGTLSLNGNIISPVNNKGLNCIGGTVVMGGTNASTGTITVSGGTFRLGAAERLANTAPVVLAGGIFSTNGNSETVGTLNLTASTASTIALTSANHTLTFANSSSLTPWGAGATLVITGWNGTAGQSNTTGGKIIVGAAGLTSQQLAKISFQGYLGTSIIVGGELVPPGPSLSVTAGSLSHGATCVGVPATFIDYTITNTGGTAVGVNVTSSNGEFAVSNIPTTVTGGGGTATFRVTFTPTASGARTASLTLSTTSANAAITNPGTLTGTGNALPTANAGGALAAICQGSTTAALGGSFGGSATAAVWSDGGAGGTFTNNTGTTPNTATYTASSTAPATVTLTLTTSGGLCGTTFVTKSLTVNPTAIVNGGSAIAAICQGSTTAALGGSFGGSATSAVWSDGSAGGTFTNNSGSTPGTTTYTAAFNAPSPVTLTLTTSGGLCGAAVATKQLVVNPVPLVSAGGPLAAICQGGTTAALGGSFSGGATSAVWTDGGAGGTFTNNSGTTPGTTTYTAANNAPASITLTLTTSGGLCGTTLSIKTLTVNSGTTYYSDAVDGDGYGDPASPIVSCTGQPANYVANNTDCSPTTANYRLGNFYTDSDNDGYNNGAPVTSVCYGLTSPSGYTSNNIGTDCLDSNAEVNPNHVEVAGNGIDDNCDGNIDEVAPTSSLQPNQCGITLTNIAQAIYANVIYPTPAEAYRFEVTEVGNPSNIRTYDAPSNTFNLLNLAGGAEYNKTYSVRVAVKTAGFWRTYASACTLNTPAVAATTKVSNAQCGVTLSDIANTIYCDAVSSATGYRFRVTDGVTTRTVETTVNRFSLMDLAGGANFATTYTVDVQLKFGTTWETTWGLTCNITTPLTPGTSNVSAAQCGVNITNLWSTIYATQVPAATGYRFEVTKSGGGTVFYDTPNARFSLRNITVPGFTTTNSSYSIRVAILYNSQYLSFGAACTITTNGASRITNKPIEVFEVKAYPNPFANNFKLELNTSSENNVSLKVYDMIGRQIDIREASVTDITNLEIGDQYPSGVYNVIVTQGDQLKTLRIIKR